MVSKITTRRYKEASAQRGCVIRELIQCCDLLKESVCKYTSLLKNEYIVSVMFGADINAAFFLHASLFVH